MEEVTVKNYQQLAMRTCLTSAKNWDYCYCLIASEIGEAFGKWGKKFRDGSFDKDKLADELGDVFWGLALACELKGESFERNWASKYKKHFIGLGFYTPNNFNPIKICMVDISGVIDFAKRFAEQCGIAPLDCLRRNIAKLADRQERGVIRGNGDNR